MRDINRAHAHPGRQDFQPEFFRNFHHAQDVLLLLRNRRADFLEEPLETRRRDDALNRPGAWPEYDRIPVFSEAQVASREHLPVHST